MDSLEVYLDNVAAAATQTVAKGGPLTKLAAILEISFDSALRNKNRSSVCRNI